MRVSKGTIGLTMAFLAGSLGASAAEDYAGTAVRRDFTDARGNRFAVTVTPPADRAVDTRFFDAIEVAEGDDGAVENASASSAGEPLDVSGYVVELERLSGAATCTSSITLKTKPVSLGGNQTFSVTSSGQPMFVSVTAFPKSGNVDAYVLNGGTTCESSSKGSNQLDNATCLASACVGGSTLIGQVRNPSSSNATYVTAINMVFQASGTTPPPTSGADPSIVVKVDKPAGKSPLKVGFSLCDSRDGSGGKNLTYLADFEGTGTLAQQNGCGFDHTYKSNGVTVYQARLAVRDASGRQAESKKAIKSYVDVAISVDKTTGCAGTVLATAQLLKSASQGVRALADVDRVQFEAFNAAGQSLGKREGTKAGSEKWISGTWNVNDNTKLRVRATVYAQGVAGDNQPEDTRPECGG